MNQNLVECTSGNVWCYKKVNLFNEVADNETWKELKYLIQIISKITQAKWLVVENEALNLIIGIVQIVVAKWK